jgi:hypothetical protein
MPLPQTPCSAMVLLIDQRIGDVNVISFDLGNNSNRVAPEITVKARPHLFVILHQKTLNLYVDDAKGYVLTFVGCAIATGFEPIIFKAMDETGESIYR